MLCPQPGVLCYIGRIPHSLPSPDCEGVLGWPLRAGQWWEGHPALQPGVKPRLSTGIFQLWYN